MHMLMSLIATNILLGVGLVPRKPVANRRQFLNICQLAAVSGVSIVLGIGSLRYIALSLDQAVGATTPAFAALLAYLMLGKVEDFEVR